MKDRTFAMRITEDVDTWLTTQAAALHQSRSAFVGDILLTLQKHGPITGGLAEWLATVLRTGEHGTRERRRHG